MERGRRGRRRLRQGGARGGRRRNGRRRGVHDGPAEAGAERERGEVASTSMVRPSLSLPLRGRRVLGAVCSSVRGSANESVSAARHPSGSSRARASPAASWPVSRPCSARCDVWSGFASTAGNGSTACPQLRPLSFPRSPELPRASAALAQIKGLADGRRDMGEFLSRVTRSSPPQFCVVGAAPHPSPAER